MSDSGVGSGIPPSEREKDDAEHAEDGETRTIEEWDNHYRDEYNVRMVNPQGFLPVDWDEEVTEKEFLEGLAESEAIPPGEGNRIKSWIRQDYDGPVDVDELDVNLRSAKN